MVSWWWRTLVDMAPFGLSKKLQVGAPSLLFCRVLEGHVLVFLYEQVDNSTRQVVSVPFTEQGLHSSDWLSFISGVLLKKTAVVLLLEPHQVLSQVLTFPEEAEKNLQQLFRFEMDRFTPFRVDDVYFSYKIIERDSVSRCIQVLLFVSLKENLDSMLNSLNAAQLSFCAVDVIGADSASDAFNSQGCGVNILPVHQRRSLPRQDLLKSGSLTFLIVAAVIFSYYYTLSNKQQYFDYWQQKVTAITASTSSVVDLKKQVDEAGQAAGFVANKKNSALSLTAVLYRLTQVLPDNTHVQQLYVKNNEVEIHGLSASAAKLIPLLENTRWFAQVMLRAPIVQDRKTAKERYKIRMNAQIDAIHEHDALPSNEINKAKSIVISDSER